MNINIIFVCFSLKVVSSVQTINEVPYIAGGLPAQPGQFPYQASMYVVEHELQYCAGVILNSRWIVSATFCLLPFPYPFTVYDATVLVGSVFRKNGTHHQVIDAVPYRIGRKFYGIGLVKVDPEIQFNDLVQPIEVEEKYINENVFATTMGWGYIETDDQPDLLKYINVTTISNERCEKIYDSLTKLGYIESYHLCAESPAGMGTCHGDTGSALVADGKLIGISAFVWKCGTKIPDGFVRVSMFKNWIDGIINED